MWRFSHRSRGGVVYPAVLGLFGFELNLHEDTPNSPTAKKMQKENSLEPLPKGWDAIKLMFSKQEPNGVSVEVLSCTQLGLCSFIAGFIIGGIENTKFTVSEYKERNQATIYNNTFEAQRSVQDQVSKAFFKGGFKLGLKCGSFLFCIRGKTSISDFAVGGFVTGSLFTLNRGLAGSLSGGLVGLVLGSLAGTVLVGSLYACGIDLNEVRMWQYNQYQKRVNVEHYAYLKEREHMKEENEKVAFYILKQEEKEKGRIIDKLENPEKRPTEADVIIPVLPPESMFRKEGKN